MSTHRHHVLELPTPLMWEEHVDNFIVFLRSQGLVATSIRTKRNHVLQLARAFPDTTPPRILDQDLWERCGLRCVEIAQVEAGDVYEDADGWNLFVRGKGGRTRTVPITADLARAITDRCASTGQFAFPGRCGGHMAANSVSQIGRRILPGTWTLHKLRHRYATKAYSAEHDLLTVRELLGHASLQTTVRYIAPSPRARNAVLAATRIHSPA